MLEAEASKTMIDLTVNGKSGPIDDSVDLETYLLSFGLNLQFVAVGYNGEVVKKESFANLQLKKKTMLLERQFFMKTDSHILYSL